LLGLTHSARSRACTASAGWPRRIRSSPRSTSSAASAGAASRPAASVFPAASRSPASISARASSARIPTSRRAEAAAPPRPAAPGQASRLLAQGPHGRGGAAVGGHVIGRLGQHLPEDLERVLLPSHLLQRIGQAGARLDVHLLAGGALALAQHLEHAHSLGVP